MKTINGFACAATLLSLSFTFNVSHAAREDLPTLFDEDTLLYLEIPSIPQLKEDWEANPLYELYQREEVKAFVVIDEGISIAEKELADFVAAKLAYFKVPAHWEIGTSLLPRNPTGKVLKNVLTGEAANRFVEE